MWVEWPPFWIAVANVLVIPAVHLGVSWLASRLPDSIFSGRDPESGVYAWEVRFYERFLLIRLWKDSLPDAAPLFGGLPKRQLQYRDASYLRRFAAEARRGEWAHWVQAILILVCVLWTPMPWAMLIAIYALLSNLPCIFNQRYTRMRIGRVLRKKRQTERL